MIREDTENHKKMQQASKRYRLTGEALDYIRVTTEKMNSVP